MPLTQHHAQLVIAREHGFTGWQDLMAEVSTRRGRGQEWAAALARRIIHDNDESVASLLLDRVIALDPELGAGLALLTA